MVSQYLGKVSYRNIVQVRVLMAPLVKGGN